MALFIHLGAHKTATTHLARCVLAAENDLLQAGVVFLDPAQLRQPPLELRALISDPGKSPKQQKLGQEILRGLMAEQRDLILSEEQILGGLGASRFLGRDGRVYPQAGQRLGKLLDLLGTRDVTLLLGIRSPADFLTSTFGEQLRHGGPLQIEEFLGDYDPRSLRWCELVERLLAESGAMRLVCWRYEDLRAVRDEVLTIMLGPDLASVVPDLPPTRVGLSGPGYRALLQQADGARVDGKLIGALLKAHPKQAGGDRLRLLSDELHDICERNYAEDCARIAALPGVRMLSPKAQG